MTTQWTQHALPKGRMYDEIARLLSDAGCPVQTAARNYRARIDLDGFSTKILKPQGIVEMLAVGRRDLGFAGADWVAELGVDLVELIDTELNPVRIVAAAPTDLLVDGTLPDRPLIVASEYARITQDWITEKNLEARFVRSWGATEVLPPEDADCIVDNTASGATLEANRLTIVDTLMRSSTRLYANPRSLECPTNRERIEALVLLLRSVLEARSRVMIEVNVAADVLDRVVALVPAMRQPTVAQLAGSDAFALKAAVPRTALARLIPQLKKAGASDLVVSRIDQIVP
jgi:ATP phosphoribosyltransferase